MLVGKTVHHNSASSWCWTTFIEVIRVNSCNSFAIDDSTTNVQIIIIIIMQCIH